MASLSDFNKSTQATDALHAAYMSSIEDIERDILATLCALNAHQSVYDMVGYFGLALTENSSLALPEPVDIGYLAMQADNANLNDSIFCNFAIDKLIGTASSSEVMNSLALLGTSDVAESCLERECARTQESISALEFAYPMLSSIEVGTAIDAIYLDNIDEALRQSLIDQASLVNLGDSLQALTGIGLLAADVDSAIVSESFLQTIGYTQPFLDALSASEADLVASVEALIPKVNLGDQFFSDALICSGLDSPFVHQRSYPDPSSHRIGSDSDLENRATTSQNRLTSSYSDQLKSLEVGLRRFIEAVMNSVYGDAWWETCSPSGVQDGCSQRKARRETNLSLKHHPIEYAYLDDLRQIILKRANWRVAFSGIFKRQSEVETIFFWLEPVRQDIAHSRHSSEEDYIRFSAAAISIQSTLENWNGGRALA